MSRIANAPIAIPAGVQVSMNGQQVEVKGPKGTAAREIHSDVTVRQEGEELMFAARKEIKASRAMAGTMRALVNNMVTGVTQGFEKKLQLVGVGYRAQSQGKVLNLTLGFSHPVNYELPEGIAVATPTQTEIVVSGIDKQLVGQVAANIRAYRPPEPYKGKGVKYADEIIMRKEAKKK